MIDYLNKSIKKDYIEWVKFIYDDYNDNMLDSILTNEKLFVAFVEDKINTDIQRYFCDSKYVIKINKADFDWYYCSLYLNGIAKIFGINNSFTYELHNQENFNYMYYKSTDTIDLPF